MRKSLHRKAFTLVELTLVIGLVLGMTAMSVFGLTYFTYLARAQRAEGILRQVENARLSYLMDNPTETYSSVTGPAIDPYLPGGWIGAQEVLTVNGYKITEADLKTPLISYSVVTGGLTANLWAMRIRGFNCTNCPKG